MLVEHALQTHHIKHAQEGRLYTAQPCSHHRCLVTTDSRHQVTRYNVIRTLSRSFVSRLTRSRIELH